MLTWWAVGTWAATAAGGLIMAALFLRHHGLAQSERSAIGPLRVFPHVGLAVAGFVLWIIYAITDVDVLGWLAVVGIGGAFLIAGTFLLTRDQHRLRELERLRAGPGAAAGIRADTAPAGYETRVPAEAHIPIVLASLHGLLGAGTLVLVLLVQAGVGGS
jgi:hypothetical protein